MILSIRADLFAVEPTAAFSVTFLVSFRFGITYKISKLDCLKIQQRNASYVATAENDYFA